jgi:hypothetical protein
MGLIEVMAERVIRSKLVPLVRQYSGDGYRQLKLCILLNIDLLAAFKGQGGVGGVSYDQVRALTRKFPSVQKVVTVENLRRWLEEDCPEAVAVIDRAPGGWLYMQMLIDRVRREFFG